MALSGLDIYKLLPKTNCRKCGFATCLAFAMQLVKKSTTIDKCPYISKESKDIIESQSEPPIKTVAFKKKDCGFQVGGETVLFRHEEKFRNPCALGFILEDSLTDNEIKNRVEKINGLKFERVGQPLKPNIIVVEQKGGAQRFIEVVRLVSDIAELALGVIFKDLKALEGSLTYLKDKKPLVYYNGKENLTEIAKTIKDIEASLVVSAGSLDTLSDLVGELNKSGHKDIVLEIKGGSISDNIWNLTQARRLALKKNHRSLGFPFLVRVSAKSPYEEAMEAATYIAKYASIVLISDFSVFEVLPLLTLRQNIYTDPQKPLQIEPKVYSVGVVSDKSPVLITTNFSLSYFTVLGEVEASKVPSYIVSVDTEGMSVLTAWAAEKFTPKRIADSLEKYKVRELISHNRLIIPGYVSVISGDLKDASGFNITVGPKEAAGIPSFLRNL
jgi:acetyl-CoA decarbonylase/synthase, CODH/ACS complex subunit gamma